MTVQIFLNALATVALVFASFLLAGMAVRFELFCGAKVFAAAAFATVLTASIAAWLHRPAPALAARGIDERAHTRDRFATALAFSNLTARTALQTAALEECGTFIDRVDPRPWTNFSVPALAKWIGVPLTAMLLVAWHHHGLDVAPTKIIDPAAEEELMKKSGALTELAEQLKPHPELDEIAAKLREAAARIHEGPRANAEQARKAALRELSALEAQMKSGREASRSEWMNALAEALKNVPDADRARDALQSADAAKTAEALERLARDAEKNTALQSRIEQALRDAEEHLRQQGNRSSQKLAEMNEIGATASAALQRLAQMLREMGGSRPPSEARSGSGTEPNPEMMKQLLQALQNLKYGLQPGRITNSKNAKGGQNGSVAIIDFGNQKPKDGGGKLLPLPTGLPGSEQDEGTTDTALGEHQNPEAGTPQATQISGVLGEGESLEELVAASGDDSKAQRRYREIYDAAAPLAEDTVLNENIPLGSRFFIKRYFESIRPKE